VKDVVPALETNYSGIKEVLESLVKTYKGKEEEFGAFQREYGIQVNRELFSHLAMRSAACRC
jgi:prefoldin subunit 2